MNKCIFLGRAVRDIELGETANGTQVANFTMAVDRGYKNSNGERQSDFFNMVAFRGTAETLARYVKKGDRLAVVCNAQNETYEKDGTKRTITRFVVSNFDLLGEHRNGEQTENNAVKTRQQRLDVMEDDGQLPF